MPGKDTYSADIFYLEDLPRTLFPLVTNKRLVELGSDALLLFARKILEGQGAFLPQKRVHANKDARHLRRTVKLDPVAEFYLYDLVYRNRSRFRRPISSSRAHFGYRFSSGRPISSTKSYSDFRRRVFEDHIMSEEFISFDISAYFNNIYHHDIQAWFAALEPREVSDIEAFGKFLRQTNAGRSLDCLPQGLYPTKMIGNDFLRFIEESSSIKASRIVRFMDDVILLGDDAKSLQADFEEAQRLLGLKGLNVNSSKTKSGGTPFTGEVDEHISELKKTLLRRRREIVVRGYSMDDEGEEIVPLDSAEINFILELLRGGDLGEDDAELIMIVMRDNADMLTEHLQTFIDGYPHLAKNLHGLCGAIPDKESVASRILETVLEQNHLSEFQLFWFAVMLDDYLLDSSHASDLVRALYQHPAATEISRAKVLEIADFRYGLPSLREGFLREGRSDWLAWASAVGSSRMHKQARNYLLDYFKNGSSMNALIAEILKASA